MNRQYLIAMLILFICAFYFLLIYEIEEEEDDYPVDIVYTWVEGEDPERETYKVLEGIQKKDGNSTQNRFNNNEELRYSLRSIDMYCPWVNKIYIFVKDGQSPEFVDFSNPKISLVTHSQAIPLEYLPLFNSNVIEQHIHKIPGLSDHYIYFNDDLMVNLPTKRKDFFRSGKPVINYKNQGIPPNYGNNVPDLPYNHPLLLKHNYDIAKDLFLVDAWVAQHHTPSPCYKPWEEELEKLIKESGFWTTRRFRTNRDVCLNNFLRTIFYATKNAKKVYWGEGYFAFKNDCKIHNTYDDKKFICVNEILTPCEDSYFDFISAKFPIKSQYEI